MPDPHPIANDFPFTVLLTQSSKGQFMGLPKFLSVPLLAVTEGNALGYHSLRLTPPILHILAYNG